MANIRVSDIVQPYAGEGDVVQWLDKLTLVVKRLKNTSVADVLPLFLDGPAYAVYSEMPEADKKDSNLVAAALKEAFGLNSFLAYEEFTSRRWRDGEAVDVYLAELRRLAKLADVETDSLLRRQFIVGLPVAVSRELRAMRQVSATPLSDILNRARSLLAESTVRDSAAVSVANIQNGAGKSRRCFRCGGAHFVKNCTAPAADAAPRCWTCGMSGHTSRYCTQGNAPRRAAALAALPNTQ